MDQVEAQPNATRAYLKPSAERRLGRALVEIGRYSVLTFFLVIFLLPFIWFLFMALKTDAELAADPFYFPHDPQWGNFAKAWTQGHYSNYMLNTVIYTLSIVTGVAFFSCMGGYALAKLRFPGRDGVFIMILVGLMVPFLSLMIPMYYLVRDLNLLGTRLGLILPVMSMALPFGTFLMRAFFRSLPDELGDAGRIDGCNEWKVFRHIMLPLAWPGLTTLIVFEFMWSWNLFLQPLVLLQRDELRPVALALLFFTGRFCATVGLVAAGIMLTVLPVIIVYLILTAQVHRRNYGRGRKVTKSDLQQFLRDRSQEKGAIYGKRYSGRRLWLLGCRRSWRCAWVRRWKAGIGQRFAPNMGSSRNSSLQEWVFHWHTRHCHRRYNVTAVALFGDRAQARADHTRRLCSRMAREDES